MTRSTPTRFATDWYALAFALAMIALLSACHKAKNYSWQNILPTVGCEPRTPQAKSQLGGCPKVTDPQHPTADEVREFVNYMNKKDVLEGTSYNPPGCLKWIVDPQTQRPSIQRTAKKEGCSDTELEKLKKFKMP